MTSYWARWRLKSSASRMFTHSFVQAQFKENIKAPRHWPLRRDFTGEAVPAQRASNAENVSIWWRHHGSENPSALNILTGITKFQSDNFRKIFDLTCFQKDSLKCDHRDDFNIKLNRLGQPFGNVIRPQWQLFVLGESLSLSSEIYLRATIKSSTMNSISESSPQCNQYQYQDLAQSSYKVGKMLVR